MTPKEGAQIVNPIPLYPWGSREVGEAAFLLAGRLSEASFRFHLEQVGLEDGDWILVSYPGEPVKHLLDRVLAKKAETLGETFLLAIPDPQAPFGYQFSRHIMAAKECHHDT